MSPPLPALSVRIDLPNGTRFGPGKAELLRHLMETGSIKAAAQNLSMSYPRALKLIEQMNDAFLHPLVEAKHGGPAGGGATVTDHGRNILKLYDDICSTSAQTSTQKLSDLSDLCAK